MKQFLFSLIFIITCVGSFSASSQTKQFSGKWKINSNSSDFGNLSPEIAAPKYLEVMIHGDTITVSRTFGEKSQVETLIFGAQDDISSPDDRTLRKANVKNFDNRYELLFSTHYEVDGKEWEYHRTEKWYLSKDFKILTMERITNLPDKVDKVKAIFDRVEVKY